MAVEVSADEVALLAEMIVDRAVYGSEFLECLHPLESLHRPLSSLERLVRILGPIVEPRVYLLTVGVADLFQGGAAGSEAVHDGGLRPCRGWW